MTLLPIPTTTSPGKLKLVYTAGILVHEVGTNVRSGVDITDVTAMGTEAGTLGDLVKAAMPDTVTITGWKIVNPSGVTLHEEAFATPKVGTLTISGDMTGSESATYALTGKGAPAVGLRQGQCKFTMFRNFYSPGQWASPTVTTVGDTAITALRSHLNGSSVIGADFYGSPGQWRALADLQINAHYQKRFGI